VSVFVWVMMGIAIWHACVLVPDRFYGGLVGGFVTAVAGAVASGFLLPSPGIPPHNPPGLDETLWPLPGCLLGLAALWVYGNAKERETERGGSGRGGLR
jgi:hypothetical protein